MNNLEEAARRLQRAVTRLEALTEKLGQKEMGTGQLALELAEARAESRKLREVNEAVVSRLDGAIERLGAVLES
jgi:hypothetical protein